MSHRRRDRRRAAPWIALGALVLALTAPSAATATEPASTYNAPGQAHANACAAPSVGGIPLRCLDGSADGFGIPDPLAYDDGSCPGGTLRLDLHEVVDSPAGPLVFERGGNGYVDDQNAKYGQVLVSDLAESPGAPTPSGGGRGASCPALLDARYAVQIASIPDTMHYKPNSSSSKFDRYGDPGSAQGDRHDIHYSYLLWSFLNVGGGGMVRALLQDGQVVAPCDVDPVLMNAYDTGSTVDGTVLARYVRTEMGGTPLYGWMVWEHQSGSDPVIEHQHLLDGTPVVTPPQTPISPPVIRTASAASTAAATSTRSTATAAPTAPAPAVPAPATSRTVLAVIRLAISRRGTLRV
ncbi:MAG TPA: hypothetical protein VGI67_13960, partial [Thermoleophilaceae bacterium]